MVQHPPGLRLEASLFPFLGLPVCTRGYRDSTTLAVAVDKTSAETRSCELTQRSSREKILDTSVMYVCMFDLRENKTMLPEWWGPSIVPAEGPSLVPAELCRLPGGICMVFIPGTWYSSSGPSMVPGE